MQRKNLSLLAFGGVAVAGVVLALRKPAPVSEWVN